MPSRPVGRSICRAKEVCTIGRLSTLRVVVTGEHYLKVGIAEIING